MMRLGVGGLQHADEGLGSQEGERECAAPGRVWVTEVEEIEAEEAFEIIELISLISS